MNFRSDRPIRTSFAGAVSDFAQGEVAPSWPRTRSRAVRPSSPTSAVSKQAWRIKKKIVSPLGVSSIPSLEKVPAA